MDEPLSSDTIFFVKSFFVLLLIKSVLSCDYCGECGIAFHIYVTVNIKNP